MAYTYVAYDTEGKKVRGELIVDSEQAAEDLLFGANLTVVQIKRKLAVPSLQDALPTFFRPKTTDIVAFTRQLCTLLESGIPLRSGLQLLQDQTPNQVLVKTIQDIVRQVEEGTLFSAALAKHPMVFNAFYQHMAAVGEETGRLEPMLRRTSDYLERDAGTASRVKRALIYPSIVLMVGIGAVIVLVLWTVPALSRLFSEFDTELPLTTRFLIGMGSIATRFGSLILVASVGLAVLGFWYLRTKAGARRRDYLLMRAPIIGKTIQTSSTAHFTSMLNALLRAGLPIPQILDILSTSTSFAPMRDVLGSVKTDLLAGERLGQAMKKHKVFPRLLVQMATTGDETGSLETNLEAAARFYEEATIRAVDGTIALLEPALVLLIGLGIGFVAVSVVTPMYTIIQHIR